ELIFSELSGSAGYITCQQHVYQTGRSALPEAGFPGVAARILKSAEQHVDQRQVGVVLAMHATLVMQRMAFRPLDQVTEPAWRIQVGVLKHTEKRDEEQRRGCGLGWQADQG